VGVDRGHERDPAGSTLHNTQLYLGPDGAVAAKHRKLMPTGGERLVWGMGDGSTLAVVDTPFGRLGGLTCWENYMPLARYAMYAKGVDVWAAPTWDTSDVWVPTLRHLAKEGRMYVIGVAPLLRGSDVPADLPGRDELYGGEEDWLSRGLSAIVGPRGEVLAGTRQHLTTEQAPAADGPPADHTAAAGPRPDHGGASHAP
jgi:nitrilase